CATTTAPTYLAAERLDFW
nr:immunoglobulin heavy chain junction region [Macaca mulatta]MOW98646.1 immunoglobulin heavy chain junction region [Macaca mulatta]MOW98946.1 immunoglobulin heavy chain junction region [Macaca mulatta]MOW99775.1 immunoglobulin heavy chain junction region [Macaca mulatta]MOX00063.1 immunoglobulin heavy chain junction region [Macaca mulatta]